MTDSPAVSDGRRRPGAHTVARGGRLAWRWLAAGVAAGLAVVVAAGLLT